MKNKLFISISLFLLCAISLTTQAKTYLLTRVAYCKNMAGSKIPFILELHSGEPVIKSILNCAKKANLTAASINGLGLIKEPKLSYYNMQTQKLDYKTFNGVYELVVLNGDIVKKSGRGLTDIHAVLGSKQYTTLAGHLEEATALLRVDIIFTPLAQ